MIGSEKTRALAWASLLVAGSAGLVWSQQGGPALPTRDARRATLAKVHQARLNVPPPKGKHEGADLDAESARLVRGVRAGFQEIPTGRGDQVRFVRVLLNADGAGFDAIRFRTPAAGSGYAMKWEFITPGDMETRKVKAWNLLPAAGERPRIGEDWARRDDFELPGTGLPSDNFCLTQDLSGPLQPGAEYLVWFDLKDDQPVPIFVKVRLDPVEPLPPPRTPAVTKARAAFQTALGAAERKHDADLKALRQRYFAELEKEARDAAARKDDPEHRRILAEVEEVRRGDGDADSPAPRGFRVIRADYGAGERWGDATKQVQALVRGNSLRFDQKWDLFPPDPAFGVVKTLVITYALDGNLGVSITRDDQQVELPPPPGSRDRIPPVY